MGATKKLKPAVNKSILGESEELNLNLT